MYPSWRYHPTKAPRLIQSASEEPGSPWTDSPADHGLEPSVPPGAPLGTSSRMQFVPQPSEDDEDTEAVQDALSVPSAAKGSDVAVAKATVAARKAKAAK